MKNKGFSLVELIVVIAIMAILVGVAVPVYTSYIDKADEAKDAELLDEINRAFTVVCAGEALDINTVTDATIAVAADGAIDLAGMTVKVGDETITTLGAKMVEILGEDLEFNTITAIFYNKTTHTFVTLSPEYAALLDKISDEDVAALLASAFMRADGLGVEGLLNKVGEVVDFAAAFESGVYEDLFADEGYLRSICTAMGIDVSEITDYDELMAIYETAIDGAVKQKVAAMAGVSVGDLTDEHFNTYGEAALGQVLANSAVLYAAENASNDPDAVMSMLSGENPRQAIVGSLNSSYGAGLTNASVAYGMYTAYAYSTGDAALIEKTKNPVDIMNGLSDPGFQEYLDTPQAQVDLEGYLAAMNMINSSSQGNADAVNKLLVDGFDDPELIALIQQATKE